MSGLREAGWTHEDLARSLQHESQRDQHNLQHELQQVRCARTAPHVSRARENTRSRGPATQILSKLKDLECVWPFLHPVDTVEVPDYLDVVSEPIDLETMEERVKHGAYKSKAAFLSDLERMIANCRAYNDPKTQYYKCANDLEAAMIRIVRLPAH